MLRDAGSFRDTDGQVFYHGGRVLRVLSARGWERYSAVADHHVLQRLRDEGRVVDTRVLPVDEYPCEAGNPPPAAILEHAKLPLVSYPYEWPFAALQTAAVEHLVLHRELLAAGLTLKDASAFNIAFIGARPIFLDALSVTSYNEGEYWLGHDQFLRQFLNPLLLEVHCGMTFAALYRGDIEGIDSTTLSRLLPVSARLRPSIIMNVVLPAYLDARARRQATVESRVATPRRPLPKAALLNVLEHLTRVVEGLRPSRARSNWSDYSVDNSYATQSKSAKQALVREFVARLRPRRLLDIGANDGEYTRLALAAGAASAVMVDNDREALDRGFRIAERDKLPVTVLCVDLANPSPAQGWRGTERSGLWQRLDVDALLALAVVHHLAIGRNVPLAEVVDMLVSVAPRGLVEFVPKSDPMVAKMLASREDIFADYNIETFRAALAVRATITSESSMQYSDRTMFEYARGERPA